MANTRLLRIIPATALFFVFPVLLYAEKGFVVLFVQDAKGHPIKGVQLGVEGIGSTGITGSEGKLRVRLGRDAEEGDPVSLIVEHSPKGMDYVILSPWGHRSHIPKFADKPENFIEVVLVQRGDRAILETGRALRSIAEQINDSNAPKPSNEASEQSDPVTALRIVAKQYGLDPEDVDKAIRAWGSTVSDPYEKGLADYYNRSFSKATAEFRESLDQEKAKIASETEQATKAAFFLGMSLYSEGNYREAANAFEECLRFHPDDLYVMYARVKSLTRAEDFVNADIISSQALLIAKATLPPDDPRLASALDNQGSLLITKGKAAEAEVVLRQAIAILRKVPGPIAQHNLAVSLNSLGFSLATQHKNAEAEEAYNEAILNDDIVLGPDNLESALYRNNRALLFLDEGREEEADQEFHKILALREKKEGLDHPDVGATLYGLARVLEDEHRYKDAEPYARRLFAIDEKKFSPNSSRIASDLYELGMILKFNGEYEEADADLMRSMTIRHNPAGLESVEYGRALTEHALVLVRMGHLSDAEQQTRQAVKIFEEAVPESDRDVALRWEILAAILRLEGNFSESQSALKKAFGIAQRGLGPSDHITQRIQSELSGSPF